MFCGCISSSHSALGGAHPAVSLPVRAAGFLRRCHVGLPILRFIAVLSYEEVCAVNIAFCWQHKRSSLAQSLQITSLHNIYLVAFQHTHHKPWPKTSIYFRLVAISSSAEISHINRRSSVLEAAESLVSEHCHILDRLTVARDYTLCQRDSSTRIAINIIFTK
jgi:hypothetical protein